MKIEPLTAYPRTTTGRQKVKKLRAQGRLPAVLYGPSTSSQDLEVSAHELDKLIHQAVSEILLLDLEVQNDSRPKRLALVKDIQHEPLSGRVLHVDFLEVTEDQKVTVTIPVEPTGEPIGVKQADGLLERVRFTVPLRGQPKKLPEVINVDVTPLNVGETIHFGDLQLPEGVELAGERHVPIFSVAGRR